MSNDNTPELDFSLLDKDLSDIEDLPGFEVPSNGEYILQLKSALKMVNNKPAVEASYVVVECVKKDNDADPDSKEGTKFSQLFFLTGDGSDPEKDAEMQALGLGKLKQLVAGVAEQVGVSNMGVLLRDHLKECVVTATVKRRVDTKDKDRIYATVKNMQLA